MEKFIETTLELFKGKVITVTNKIDFENNPLMIILPDGCGYRNKKMNLTSFSEVVITFEEWKGEECFTVCVDSYLFINDKFKLVDKEIEKCRFYKDSPKMKYSSIFSRAMAVVAAICEGKIKLSDNIDKSQD
jgi:hypothetical protein